MAGGKESPRQKMIGMMYLVLTALLALNVSAEVLQAFNNITRGINVTIEATKEKNEEMLRSFQKRVDNSGGDAMAKKCWEKVQIAQNMTQELYDFIEKIKKDVVEGEGSQEYGEIGGDPESYLGSKGEHLVEQKNTDISSRMLAGENPKFTYGQDLKAKINDTKTKLAELFQDLDPEKVEIVKANITLDASDAAEGDKDRKGPKKNWEYYTFNNIPVGATLAVLTKIQNDVKNAETEVINQLYAQISATKIEIEDFEPVVKQNKAILARGEELEARIFLSAIVGSITPEITVDDKPVEMEGAKGVYKVTAGNQGKFENKVMIKVANAKTGKVSEYPTTINYEVFSADATISATKMNVLYLGLDNPIEISVPGYEPAAINATLSPSSVGTLTKTGAGQYTAKIRQRLKDGCKIIVSVRTKDGKSLNKGSADFRTMKVPSPYANINNKTGGSISSAELKVVRSVNATLSNFVFEGVRYKVTAYDFIFNPKRGNLLRGNARGSAIPANLKGAFNNAKRGDMLIISAVKASAPGVGEVDLPGALIFEIQ